MVAIGNCNKKEAPWSFSSLYWFKFIKMEKLSVHYFMGRGEGYGV
jgi:hypothetical protein